MSFWEEGAARKEGLRRSQPGPGCVGSLEFSQLQNNTCDHPYLFPKPTPSVGSQLARAGSCWLEQRWRAEGGVQAEVWKGEGSHLLTESAH